ncbi:MAG: hypothetical protein IJR99_09420 [Kiritimatiellae bacterium]|nr:hypothetical protein [Kiritimatiellia bacterium]
MNARRTFPLQTAAVVFAAALSGYAGSAGRITAHKMSPALRKNLAEVRMTAHWYSRTGEFATADELSGYKASNGRDFPARVPFLLFSPDVDTPSSPVPLVVFVPGSGEKGKDLNRFFRQRFLFDKVTSAFFQERHPCYLAAISPPWEFKTLLGGSPGKPTLAQRLLMETVHTLVRELRSPPVDTNRLYATGLSFGGNAVMALGLNFPGTFAAVVPVSSLIPAPDSLPPSQPGNWYFLYNEGDYRKGGLDIADFAALRRLALDSGCDFRLGRFPSGGHNAWNRAWREAGVWEWMFAQSLARTNSPTIRGYVRCSASLPGMNDATSASRGADGLESTRYLAQTDAKRGSWWQVVFTVPQNGKIRISTDETPGGKGFPYARVEITKDSVYWIPVGELDGDGYTVILPKCAVYGVRLVVTRDTPQRLCVREVSVE